ncbi:MAG: hypothetical protein JNL04_20060 [Rhodospirillaceae bacterium]|nr:hypothetical protein [Rhodospirillaceae bacterium]
MSMHLRGRIGTYQVLIPAGSVLDVWTSEKILDEAPTWRGRAVPYVDGRALLGEPAGKQAGALLVYGEAVDDAKLAILGLDEVLGSISVAAEMLQPFPQSLADAHRLFDGIAAMPGMSTKLLRLRSGLDLAARA